MNTESAKAVTAGAGPSCRAAFSPPTPRDGSLSRGGFLGGVKEIQDCAGMTPAQAAAALGVSVNAARLRAYRADIVLAREPRSKSHKDNIGLVIKKMWSDRRSALVDRYQECADLGLSMVETADRLGLTRSAVSLAAKRYGISFPSKSPRSAHNPRKVKLSVSAKSIAAFEGKK